MNFKLFWKKTNRGLWLGAVLLLALVLFIVIGEVRYSFQKKEIRETAKDYVQALLSVNLAEGELGADGYLTEAQKQAQTTALDQVAKQYWYTGSVKLNSHNYDLARLSELLTNWQTAVPGMVTEIACQPDHWNVFITRDGPGRVLVSLATDQMTVHGKGAAPLEGYEEGVLFPTPVNSRQEGSDEWSRTCQVYFSLELVRKGGKWQVAGMNAATGSGYSFNYGLLGMI